MHYGIVRKDEPAICPVDPSGRFSEEVVDFKGLHVKEADKHIVKMLKEKTKLVKQGIGGLFGFGIGQWLMSLLSIQIHSFMYHASRRSQLTFSPLLLLFQAHIGFCSFTIR